jgi:hypothetical protein
LTDCVIALLSGLLADVLGCAAAVADHAAAWLQSHDVELFRRLGVRSLGEIGQRRGQIDGMKFRIAGFEPKQPADWFAEDRARLVNLAGDPLQPGALAPRNDAGKGRGNMEKQVAVSAFANAAFVSP